MSANIFLKQMDSPSPQRRVEGADNIFLKQMEGMAPQKEGLGKNITRKALQFPLGYLKKYTWPADAIKSLSDLSSKQVLGEMISEDPEIDREAAEKGRKEASGYFPTQDLAEETIEKHTGIPLRPKSRTDRFIRTSGSAAGFRGGGLLEKGTASVMAPGISYSLQELGVPEEYADPIGLMGSTMSLLPGSSSKVKPSGMIERAFESVKKPTKVSKARHEKITQAVEEDFKGISDQILSNNKTYSAMKDDAGFKNKIGDLFEEVERLAGEIDTQLSGSIVKSQLKESFKGKKSKGITPSESERSFKKEMAKIYKSIPNEEAGAAKWVEQFRKNNSELGSYFEPGKSKAFNTGKRDALLEYNRSIEEAIKKQYPDSEFGKLFEFTNNRWREIKDVESVEKFTSELFEGKINYKQAKKLLQKDQENIRRPFKRLLGDEGFKDFEGLVKDLSSSEKAYGFLQKANAMGFKEFFKLAAPFVGGPKVGTAALVGNYGKRAYQTLLDKPKLAITWKSGIEALEKGNVAEAEAAFKELDSAFKGS